MTKPAATGDARGRGDGPALPHRRRRWARTDATQERILDAATAVFRERGYSAATIGDVVTASGASIGSIYHHFGGKNELFLAIYDHTATVIEARISEAEKTFEAQARAYLRAVWDCRDVVVVLGSGDAPPEFARIYRDGVRRWFRGWLSVLYVDSSVSGQLRGRAIIALLSESAAMMTACRTAEETEPVIAATITLITRLTG